MNLTEEINKIALSLIDNQKIKSVESIGTYAYGMSKDLACKKKENKCNNIIRQFKNVQL